MSVRFINQGIAQPFTLLSEGGIQEGFFSTLKQYLGKGYKPQRSGTFCQQEELKMSFRSCKSWKKAGFIHINFSGQSAWPLTWAWLQSRFCWLMETSAYLTTLLQD